MTDPSSDDCTESLDLVRRAQGGEEGALNRLLERYYERVHRIVRFRLGRDLRNHLESLDILQDTFIEAVRAFDRFEMRDESSLIHWLSLIAEHRIKGAADYHHARKRDDRKDVRLMRDDADASTIFVIDPPASARQPIEQLVEEERFEVVEACMDELGLDQREVIIQRNFTGASWEDIAERIGSPSPDAARMLYARAITELARLVNRHEGQRRR